MRFLSVSAKSGNKSFFDKTSITPGTDFMNKLDEYLLSWLETNSYKLPELIIYSSHRLIGEGEHKIYHLLKLMSHQAPLLARNFGYILQL